jgi:phosphohistidine phosphatase
MNVILFRHGPAGDPDPSQWPSDVDRPLTPQGIEKTRAAARGLKRIAPDVASILTSPYVRALGTARILGETLGVTTVETLDALASGRAARGVLEALAHLKPGLTIVLVGHEPDLGNLAATLVGSSRPLPLKKAGACAIEHTGPVRAGGGHLLWYLPPRILRKLGGKKGAAA